MLRRVPGTWFLLNKCYYQSDEELRLNAINTKLHWANLTAIGFIWLITYGWHFKIKLFWKDIAILLLQSVTHGPGNSHMANHLEVPHYSQEEFLSIGGSRSEMLRCINWGLKIGFKGRNSVRFLGRLLKKSIYESPTFAPYVGHHLPQVIEANGWLILSYLI